MREGRERKKTKKERNRGKSRDVWPVAEESPRGEREGKRRKNDARYAKKGVKNSVKSGKKEAKQRKKQLKNAAPEKRAAFFSCFPGPV